MPANSYLDQYQQMGFLGQGSLDFIDRFREDYTKGNPNSQGWFPEYEAPSVGSGSGSSGGSGAPGYNATYSPSESSYGDKEAGHLDNYQFSPGIQSILDRFKSGGGAYGQSDGSPGGSGSSNIDSILAQYRSNSSSSGNYSPSGWSYSNQPASRGRMRSHAERDLEIGEEAPRFDRHAYADADPVDRWEARQAHHRKYAKYDYSGMRRDYSQIKNTKDNPHARREARWEDRLNIREARWEDQDASTQSRRDKAAARHEEGSAHRAHQDRMWSMHDKHRENQKQLHRDHIQAEREAHRAYQSGWDSRLTLGKSNWSSNVQDFYGEIQAARELEGDSRSQRMADIRARYDAAKQTRAEELGLTRDWATEARGGVRTLKADNRTIRRDTYMGNAKKRWAARDDSFESTIRAYKDDERAKKEAQRTEREADYQQRWSDHDAKIAQVYGTQDERHAASYQKRYDQWNTNNARREELWWG